MSRKERIEALADQIERELRVCIATEPYPFYTDLRCTCDYCYTETTRDQIKVVADHRGIFDESYACLECVDKFDLTISDSEKALDFEARTIAILRIRKSTAPLHELKGGE